MAADRPPLCELATVVVTTSPSPVHPSTELIEQVLQSMVVHAPALADARVIVVCDGCKASEKNMFRSGRVDETARQHYEDYKSRLRDRLGPGAAGRGLPERCELLELPTNHGFGFAVRAALALVATPLVCVLQHDRVFMRPVELNEVACAMLDREGQVGYVLLPTRSTLNYVVKQSSRLCAKGLKSPDCNIDRWAFPLPTEGRRLLPCLTWYDSTHLCLTSYYTDFVFSKKERLVKKGGFIEGELGQLQFPDFAARGVAAALERWRTYLYDDGEEAPMVGHLNGSNYESWDVLNEKFGGFGTGRVGRRWDGAADGVGRAEGPELAAEQEEFPDFLRLMRQFHDVQDRERVKKEQDAIKETGFNQNEVAGFRELFISACGDDGSGDLTFKAICNLIDGVTPLGDKYLHQLSKMFEEVTHGQRMKARPRTGPKGLLKSSREKAGEAGAKEPSESTAQKAPTADFPEFLWLLKKLMDSDFAGIRQRTQGGRASPA